MNARKRRQEQERRQKLQTQLQQSKISSNSSNNEPNHYNQNLVLNTNQNVPISTSSINNPLGTSPNNYTMYTNNTESNPTIVSVNKEYQSKAQIRNSLRVPQSSLKQDNNPKNENISLLVGNNINTIIDQSPPHKPTENEKLVQLTKMIKLFNLNVSAENIQINENPIYSKSKKEILELQEKIKVEEKNLKVLTNSIKNSTQNYIEKIITLQNELLNSPKGDIISLEEANKIDDVQVNNLLDTLYRLNDKYEREEEEIKQLVSTQIEPIQQELKNEIKEVQLLKKELMKYKGRCIPPDIKKKIEVVLKYKTLIS